MFHKKTADFSIFTQLSPTDISYILRDLEPALLEPVVAQIRQFDNIRVSKLLNAIRFDSVTKKNMGDIFEPKQIQDYLMIAESGVEKQNDLKSFWFSYLFQKHQAGVAFRWLSTRGQLDMVTDVSRDNPIFDLSENIDDPKIISGWFIMNELSLPDLSWLMRALHERANRGQIPGNRVFTTETKLAKLQLDYLYDGLDVERRAGLVRMFAKTFRSGPMTEELKQRFVSIISELINRSGSPETKAKLVLLLKEAGALGLNFMQKDPAGLDKVRKLLQPRLGSIIKQVHSIYPKEVSNLSTLFEPKDLAKGIVENNGLGLFEIYHLGFDRVVIDANKIWNWQKILITHLPDKIIDEKLVTPLIEVDPTEQVIKATNDFA